ncbi:MAG: hypothetical protein Q7R69_00680 [bacterium]|nr:hypothetical protein [bacterium]
MYSPKPDLLLVHSFPTNSVLLHGLTEFLSDYFTVHFVDLPGFHRDIPPLKWPITVEKFANYLDQKIADLNSDKYVVGGISFGFLVVNKAKLGKNCKAILAMEPFINTECLSIPFWKQRKYALIIGLMKLIHVLGAEDYIWKSKWFNEYLQRQSDYPAERVNIIIEHIDPKTFFSVAATLLNYRKRPKFHLLPHFLIGNFADTTINFDHVVEVFIKNLHELHIASEPIDHYPKTLTKEYFKTRISKEHISRILACIEG